MIREMLKEDWDKVKDIYMQGMIAGTSTYTTICPDYTEWDLAHKKDCRFVYVEDGVVVGWIALSPVSARPAFSGVAEVSIYIDEKYHHKGIGTKLLNEMSKESEKKGYWSLYSAIFTSNKASIALHKKCGFREIGYREKLAKDRFGNWQDTTMLEKRSKTI